ncbi:MAG: Crp/Fnr family transcriptional regulator [Nitrospiraceae bacterium]
MPPRTRMLAACQACSSSKQVVADLRQEDLPAFGRIKKVLSYEPHQVVFYEGHACLWLYVLCKGQVKLTRTSMRGQRLIVRIVDAGELIEKYAFVPNAIHEVTCETLERSEICLIEREPYLDLVRRNGDLAVKLIRLLSEEAQTHIDDLERFTLRSARERFADLLVTIAARFGRSVDGNIVLAVSFKREEMAEMAGITAETATRLLKAFEDEGLVILEGRNITLVHPDRLTRIAKGFLPPESLPPTAPISIQSPSS